MKKQAELVKDPDVLWLTGLIIDSSNPQAEVLDYFPGDETTLAEIKQRLMSWSGHARQPSSS